MTEEEARILLTKNFTELLDKSIYPKEIDPVKVQKYLDEYFEWLQDQGAVIHEIKRGPEITITFSPKHLPLIARLR